MPVRPANARALRLLTRFWVAGAAESMEIILRVVSVHVSVKPMRVGETVTTKVVHSQLAANVACCLMRPICSI